MENIRAVLWDVDGTLLNFLAAEKAAIRECFRRFDLGECTDAMLARYSAINRGYWEKIERGEIGKPRALVARFEDFFAGEGLDASCAAPFNAEYQVPQEEIDSVFSAAARMGVTPKDEVEKEQTLPKLRLVLKALVARDLWDMSEYFAIINEDSPTVHKALELIANKPE